MKDDMGPTYAEAWAKEFEREMERQVLYYKSPAYKARKEESDRKWKAKPWRERAAIRVSAWIDQRRVRLGEIVAGRSFDE